MATIGPLPGVAATSIRFSDLQVGEMQAIVNGHRNAFAGLAGDPVSHIVTIYLAQSADSQTRSTGMQALNFVGSAGDLELQSSPKVWTIDYVVGGNSLATLDGVLERVASAEPWRTDVGEDIVSWGIDSRQHVVRVGLERIRPSVAAEAQQVFGDTVVLTRQDRPIRQNSRLLDSLPYWGGDRVALSSGPLTQCTVAFVVQQGSTGSRGMLGAGHCYANGTNVYQGYYDSNNSFHNSGYMGKVTVWQFSNNTVDAEFENATTLGRTVQDHVYVTSGSSKVVLTSGTSFVGLTSVCFDGSFTGEKCIGTIQQADICVYIYPYTTCHMTEATASSRLSQGGDSGGPVYKNYGTGLAAYGHIVANNGQGTDGWYSELNPTLTALGLLLSNRIKSPQISRSESSTNQLPGRSHGPRDRPHA